MLLSNYAVSIFLTITLLTTTDKSWVVLGAHNFGSIMVSMHSHGVGATLKWAPSHVSVWKPLWTQNYVTIDLSINLSPHQVARSKTMVCSYTVVCTYTTDKRASKLNDLAIPDEPYTNLETRTSM